MIPPHREPFLRQVAEVYAAAEAGNLGDCCFIFPNKRSATFFADFLQKAIGSKPPCTIMTISSFVAGFSSFTEASRYDQLFTLFNEYRRIADDPDMDFESFAFWGEMLLSDFNDVDRYLVDPDRLFVNVQRFREINSNYLTDDQRIAISRYWGEERATSPADDFWEHFNSNSGSRSGEKFIHLWETLAPLFHAFHKKLNASGLTTSGALYRNAADRLSSSVSASGLRFSRHVFVGFNVLTTSELKIFSSLRDLGVADFYWDFNSPAFANGFNRAGRFIERNAREFPSIFPLSEPPIDTMPAIEVIGVPGGNAQVKCTGQLLERMVGDGTIADPTNAIDTAVVLPDESLFIPLVHSIPEQLTSINVTMGLPMRHNPVASLMRLVTGLQMRSRTIAGQTTFFRDDVLAILSNPIVAAASPQECESLRALMDEKRLFRICPDDIASLCPGLSMIFRHVGKNGSLDSVCAYLSDITAFIENAETDNIRIRNHFLKSYRAKVEEVAAACRRHNVIISSGTVFRMVERSISTDKVHFVGEPLKGLQIMGVLETRALDFDNIIVLSMNERVFPRKHYTSSFIPDALRKGYGMATTDFQESIFAYYFYRLISRARTVKLVYDARTIGTATGEMSRYVSQLMYLFGKGEIRHHLMKFEIKGQRNRLLEIKKTPEVMRRLRLYTIAGEGGRNLSASSLKEYINCPLNFYLRFVENFNPSDEIADYMDSSTFGTIVHGIMQEIYEGLRGDADEVTIEGRMINDLIKKENPTLGKLITVIINKEYNRLGEGRTDRLVGESLIVGRLIREAVIKMLEVDRRLTPFKFYKAEEEIVTQYAVNDNLTVNIRQFIDRVDRVGGRLRLVDYKTGSDRLKVECIDDLFIHSEENVKAIMQLMMYCIVYRNYHHTDEPIQPVIYSVRDIPANGLVPVMVGDEELDDYHRHAEEYESLLKSTITEIFNPDIPFTQSEDISSCRFCKFWRICGRDIDLRS